MARLIENMMFQSRWLLLPFYVGLIIALVILGISFFHDLWELGSGALTLSRDAMELAVLQLIDGVLVAMLLVMVVVMGYENFVSQFDLDIDAHKHAWLGSLDTGNLKVKIVSSIVSISAIHLLGNLLDAEHIDNKKLLVSVVMLLAFVGTALMLAYLGRLSGHGDQHKSEHQK
jgi:uncharacterized protein (TIGR00645 family)